MSKTKILVHAFWTTRRKENLLPYSIREKLIQHVFTYSKNYSIKLICFNGTENHMHVLIQLHSTQNLAYTIHLIKGESSNWLNDNFFKQGKFRWNDRYNAITVGVKEYQKTKYFIGNQKQYHQSKNLLQETYDIFNGRC